MPFFEFAEQDELLRELKALVRYAAANAPRSLQKTLGPSEIGHGCARRLAYSLARPELGEQRKDLPYFKMDPWPSIMGIAGHAWLATAVEMENERLGRQRWLSETKVTAWDDVEGGIGTCDLYDTDSESIFDFKINGPTEFKKYVKKGPSDTYKGQVNVYGKGYKQRGRAVRKVGILFIPRAGLLSDAHLWMDDFDEGLADNLHNQVEAITGLVGALDLKNIPRNFQLIPITPGSACQWCHHCTPNPGDNPYLCAGTYAQND